MINAIFISNIRGRLLLFRAYRDECTREDAENFCANYIRDKLAPLLPVARVNSESFFIVPVNDLNLMGVSTGNANCMLILETLCELRRILDRFMGGAVSEVNIDENAAAVLELLDEIVNSGYPNDMYSESLTQRMATRMNVTTGTLKPYAVEYLVNFGLKPQETFTAPFSGQLGDEESAFAAIEGYLGFNKQRQQRQQLEKLQQTCAVGGGASSLARLNAPSQPPAKVQNSAEKVTSQIINLLRGKNNKNSSIEESHKRLYTPWRCLNHTGRNIVTLNVVECVNLVYSDTGEQLSFYVLGSLRVTCHVSGKPQVQIRVNDTFEFTRWVSDYQHDATASEFKLPIAAKERTTLDDYKLHTCVDLDHLSNGHALIFVPPNIGTVLMIYKCSRNLTAPFILKPRVFKTSSSIIQYDILLKPTYAKGIVATGVQLDIPVPKNATAIKLLNKSPNSSANANLPFQQVQWTIPKVAGTSEFTIVFQSVQSTMLDPSAGGSAMGGGTLAAFGTLGTLPRLGPIQVKFELANFVSSGFYIESVTINGPKASKNVEYCTRAGHYVHRLRCH